MVTSGHKALKVTREISESAVSLASRDGMVWMACRGHKALKVKRAIRVIKAIRAR
jgi:hypothetical protein